MMLDQLLDVLSTSLVGREMVEKKKRTLQATSSVHIQIVMPKIEHCFRPSSYVDMNECCVWLTACMLVNRVDKKKANDMVVYMTNHNEECKRMVLFKATGKKRSGKRRKITHDYRSLSIALKDFELSLKHVNVPNKLDRFSHLLNATGIFVCLVTSDTNKEESHCIGVNCNHTPHLIYDCEEKQSMEYTKKNLNACAGLGSTFYSFAHMGEIIPLH